MGKRLSVGMPSKEGNKLIGCADRKLEMVLLKTLVRHPVITALPVIMSITGPLETLDYRDCNL